jgi:hypothetical protein
LFGELLCIVVDTRTKDKKTKYRKPFLYALVVFLGKWAEIKYDVPKRSNGIGRD